MGSFRKKSTQPPPQKNIGHNVLLILNINFRFCPVTKRKSAMLLLLWFSCILFLIVGLCLGMLCFLFCSCEMLIFFATSGPLMECDFHIVVILLSMYSSIPPLAFNHIINLVWLQWLPEPEMPTRKKGYENLFIRHTDGSSKGKFVKAFRCGLPPGSCLEWNRSIEKLICFLKGAMWILKCNHILHKVQFPFQ